MASGCLYPACLDGSKIADLKAGTKVEAGAIDIAGNESKGNKNRDPAARLAAGWLDLAAWMAPGWLDPACLAMRRGRGT